ncbi:rho GDP-dissociation inhibitor 1-like [Lotus japonicus]|uniref:Rho GDP-dissociation inhibitor 1-like n=1 Tax=Lotus japonicus TaxID=34305 RepID=I3SF08_LOTJA|nr:rho GDP-dissociation inhibitor 1-like [Lotus japonicus]AFK38850.1 unknown [Lotus japonicus]
MVGGGNGKKPQEEEQAGTSASGVDPTKQEMIEKPFHDGKEEEEEAEEEEEEGTGVHTKGVFVPGPLLSLKEQIERDKEDESLRRWKEKLLGCLESDLDAQVDPEVKFHSIGILSEDFGEIVTPLPVEESQNGRPLFTLWEGSCYQLKLKFSVLHNIVSGLTYSNTVWKGGFQVDQSKGMLGTFAPQKEPYVYALKEDTTPSGALARGVYSAKLKFEDDDKRCHMELKYLFEIKKSS